MPKLKWTDDMRREVIHRELGNIGDAFNMAAVAARTAEEHAKALDDMSVYLNANRLANMAERLQAEANTLFKWWENRRFDMGDSMRANDHEQDKKEK